jgi:bacteriocin biosynthesis cyclodehydratase domain-containing protein
VSAFDDRRPRLTLPFTVVPEAGRVHLIAGEDCRYTFTGAGIEDWLPALVAAVDGRLRVGEILERVPREHRSAAGELLRRLYGERIAADSGAADLLHRPRRAGWAAFGEGSVFEALRDAAPAAPPDGGEALRILCQDTLDYAAALDFEGRARGRGAPWLWVSTGPQRRAYVGPMMLPDAGPCLGCLLSQFRRLSPSPELYDALLAHGRRGGRFEAGAVPAPAARMLAEIALWKAGALADGEPPAAIFRLHVLEIASFEVEAHRVVLDPDCEGCGAWP